MKWWSFNAFLGSLLGFILLAVAVDSRKASNNEVANYCFYAENCTHSHHQKCAMNKQGKFKRFQDSCDMVKFNCENRDNYATTKIDLCRRIPSIKKRLIQTSERLPTPTTTERYHPKLYLRNFATTAATTTTLHPPGLMQVIKKMWCWIGDHCHITDTVVCGRDSRMVYMLFQSNCSMAKYNCDLDRDFVQIDVSIDDCLRLITYKVCPVMQNLVEESRTRTTPRNTKTRDVAATSAHVTATSSKNVAAVSALDFTAAALDISIEVTPKSRKAINIDIITALSKDDLITEDESPSIVDSRMHSFTI